MRAVRLELTTLRLSQLPITRNETHALANCATLAICRIYFDSKQKHVGIFKMKRDGEIIFETEFGDNSRNLVPIERGSGIYYKRESLMIMNTRLSYVSGNILKVCVFRSVQCGYSQMRLVDQHATDQVVTERFYGC